MRVHVCIIKVVCIVGPTTGIDGLCVMNRRSTNTNAERTQRNECLPNHSSTTINQLQARTTFAEFDEDGDGKLSTSELARLCHQMGSKLTHNELQAAVLTLDVNRDGYIQVRGFVVVVCLWMGWGRWVKLL